MLNPFASTPLKRGLGALLLVLTIIPLTGCVTLDLLVRIRPDGSGEIVRTVVFRNSWVTEVRKADLPGEGTDAADAELFTIEDAEWEAERMGAGVKLVGAKPTNTATARGVTATYSFPDVRKLTLSAEPPSWWKGSGPAESSDPIRFGFARAKDGLSTLSIRLPGRAVAEAGRAESAGARQTPAPLTEAEREQARLLYEGLRTVARVEVVGSVVGIEGGWRDGNRVTLFDFDFDRALASDSLLRKLTEASSSSSGEVAPLLRDVAGCRVPEARDVTISFL